MSLMSTLRKSEDTTARESARQARDTSLLIGQMVLHSGNPGHLRRRNDLVKPALGHVSTHRLDGHAPASGLASRRFSGARQQLRHRIDQEWLAASLTIERRSQHSTHSART